MAQFSKQTNSIKEGKPEKGQKMNLGVAEGKFIAGVSWVNY